MKNRNCGIYCIFSKAQNLYYVGKSVDFDKRISIHLCLLNNKKHTNLRLQRAWNKYESSNFSYELFHICEEHDLNKWEKFYISYFKSFKVCFNFMNGGTGGAQPPEIISKIQNSRKWWKPTLEHRQAISEKMIGRKITWDTKIGKKGKEHYAFGKPCNIKSIEAIAKDYIFISPEGKVNKIHNLNKFCRENNLNSGHMAQVYLGKEKQHKRWIKYVEKK